MARNREFDPTEALEKAMMVFWQKGYVDTSIDDLVDATGVSRYGLYDEFGSKRGLFLASLDHYQNTAVNAYFGIIERTGAGMPEIKLYFDTLLNWYAQPEGKLRSLAFANALVNPSVILTSAFLTFFCTDLSCGATSVAVLHIRHPSFPSGCAYQMSRVSKYSLISGIPAPVRSIIPKENWDA